MNELTIEVGGQFPTEQCQLCKGIIRVTTYDVVHGFKGFTSVVEDHLSVGGLTICIYCLRTQTGLLYLARLLESINPNYRLVDALTGEIHKAN
jgi:hypothetical protein